MYGRISFNTHRDLHIFDTRSTKNPWAPHVPMQNLTSEVTTNCTAASTRESSVILAFGASYRKHLPTWMTGRGFAQTPLPNFNGTPETLGKAPIFSSQVAHRFLRGTETVGVPWSCWPLPANSTGSILTDLPVRAEFSHSRSGLPLLGATHASFAAAPAIQK